MHLIVSFKVLVQHPELAALQEKADAYYAEHETSHKLYTTPKTAEQVQVHNLYAKKLKAIEDWEDAHPEHSKGMLVDSYGTFIQALDKHTALVADHRDGRIYCTDIENLRLHDGAEASGSTDAEITGIERFLKNDNATLPVSPEDEAGLEAEEEEAEEYELDVDDLEPEEGPEVRIVEATATNLKLDPNADLAPAAVEELQTSTQKADPYAGLRKLVENKDS